MIGSIKVTMSKSKYQVILLKLSLIIYVIHNNKLYYFIIFYIFIKHIAEYCIICISNVLNR